ncbi:membrane-spanning 4-domains subfamily A member 4A-like [Mantella aurantiaca]
MSTIRTDAEGFVIINQAGTHSSQVNRSERQQLPNGIANVPKTLETFYKGQPEALGATQIFVGVLFILFGVSLSVYCNKACSHIYIIKYTGVLFWSGLAYIVSGSLSVAASVKPTVEKVRCSLVANIISSILSAVAITLFTWYFLLYSGYNRKYCVQYSPGRECEGVFAPKGFIIGISAVQLIFVLLMFAITISTAVFASRTICRTSFQEMTVVIYQTQPATTDTTDAEAFTPIPRSSDGISEIQEGFEQQ